MKKILFLIYALCATQYSMAQYYYVTGDSTEEYYADPTNIAIMPVNSSSSYRTFVKNAKVAPMIVIKSEDDLERFKKDIQLERKFYNLCNISQDTTQFDVDLTDILDTNIVKYDNMFEKYYYGNNLSHGVCWRNYRMCTSAKQQWRVLSIFEYVQKNRLNDSLCDFRNNKDVILNHKERIDYIWVIDNTLAIMPDGYAPSYPDHFTPVITGTMGESIIKFVNNPSKICLKDSNSFFYFGRKPKYRLEIDSVNDNYKLEIYYPTLKERGYIPYSKSKTSYELTAYVYNKWVRTGIYIPLRYRKIYTICE